MIKDHLKNMLASIDIHLPAEYLDLFISKIDIVYFNKGEVITQEKSIEKSIYFLLSGAVEYHRTVSDFDDEYKQTVQLSFKNDIVGDFESFIAQKPSKYSIVALNNVKSLKISYQNLSGLYEIDNVFKEIANKIIANQYTKAKEREFILLTKTAEEQYFTFLSKMPVIIKEIPLKVLSSYLGITPQSLSRIRRSIQNRRQVS